MTKLVVDTPFGDFYLLDKGEQLWIACLEEHVPNYAHMFRDASETPSPLLLQARNELKEYFAGERFSFSIPLAINAERWEMGTPFEHRAWQTLAQIGYGRTISYKELALWMGHPKAIRAVGR